jgi:hypothetical protein
LIEIKIIYTTIYTAVDILTITSFDTGIYIILIAFLACGTEITAKDDQSERLTRKKGFYDMEDIPIKCPNSDPIVPVNLPHETDCTKFYKCFLGKRYVQSCPLIKESNTRLHYNRLIGICDWPVRAGCASCPQDSDAPGSKISHREFTCTLFWECYKGENYLRECPAYMCFSRTCQSCVANREGGNCV